MVISLKETENTQPIQLFMYLYNAFNLDIVTPICVWRAFSPVFGGQEIVARWSRPSLPWNILQHSCHVVTQPHVFAALWVVNCKDSYDGLCLFQTFVLCFSKKEADKCEPNVAFLQKEHKLEVAGIHILFRLLETALEFCADCTMHHEAKVEPVNA